jgi:hypothetical protein
MSPADCASQGGTFLGHGSTCPSTACVAPIGSCCLGKACLTDLTQADCETGFGGVWAGPNTTCPAACPPCFADVDNNGNVDADDLVAVILGWGQCTFDYQNHPNQEAHQIGLEMLGASGPLVLPAATYERINRDLGLIRAAQPALAGQIHTPAWASSLIIGVTTGADLEEVECLNTYYQGDMTFLFGFGGTDYHVVQVAGMVNIPALCAIYAQAQHVQSADPDGIIGGENFWVPTDMGDGTWAWNIDDGFHDCFDGCDCHNVYEYHVAADGQVTLVSFSQWGMKWCEF